MLEEPQDEEVSSDEKFELKVHTYEQNKAWACGPAALRVLIRYMSGIKLTEEDLILLTGATEGGADEYNMMRALDTLGFKYTQSDHGTFNRLKKHLQEGQPPMVHVLTMVGDDGSGH